METTSRQDADLVVVGAGISGLAAAWFATRIGWRVVVLEAGARAGGALHTHRAADGFWLEMGGHTCFNSYGEVLGIIRDTGLSDSVVARHRLPFRLWTDAGLKSIPSQIRFAELAGGLLRLPFRRRAGQTVKGYFAPLVGRRNFQEVFSPAFDAVICQSAEEFPADKLFRRKARDRNAPRSFTLEDGLSTLTDRLARAPGVHVLTEKEAVSLDRADGLWRLTCADATAHFAPRVVLATPSDAAAGLLRTAQPRAAGHLAKIGEASVESVGVVVRRHDTALPPVAGVIGQRQPFFSMVSRDVVDDPAQRGFTFHFRPGADRKPECIARVLGVGEERWDRVVQTRARLPALRREDTKRIGEVDAMLESVTVGLAGNYFLGLSIEDCVARSRGEVERLHRLNA